ncbi:cholecystokinin receptor type A-like [Liolophura sinensis]|uniref:cholecystokinin receptor type A-like n=1 Tax=Liolophura sinensis TaxID=3198878 RepID=UPI003158A786
MAEEEVVYSGVIEGDRYPDNYTLLKILNAEKALHHLPVTIYLTILIVLGLIGNSVALYIYYAKFKKTPSNYFVIWLAILDLLSCLLAMPFDIIDLTRPYLFNSPASCKTMRFIQSATLLTPAMTIIVIAIDRHDKVFRPFKRMSNKKAKIINVITLGVAIILALPAIFVFGRNTVPTRVKDLTGFTCSVDDSAKGKVYPYVYYAVLFLVFIVTVILLAIFYCRLWREIRKRGGGRKTRSPRATSSKEPEGESHELEETSTSMAPRSSKKQYFKNAKLPDTKENTKSADVSKVSVDTDLGSFSHNRHSVKVYGAAGKTTKIVFVVSLAFVISFLPYLIAKIVQVTVADVEEFATVGVEVVYNIATRSFFINNAINPFIYIYLNPAFRKETHRLFRALCCRLCKSNSDC